MTAPELYREDFESLPDLLHGMRNRFEDNSPTIENREDLAQDIIVVATGKAEFYLWMERAKGTQIGMPGDVGSLNYYHTNNEGERWHLISKMEGVMFIQEMTHHQFHLGLQSYSDETFVGATSP